MMRPRSIAPALLVAACLAAVPAQAQQTNAPFEPRIGQSGKDVVWVPTPQALVDRMLDMAAVTPKDFLMDLGSGDGITVITAARRGVKAVGIEYNPDMVELSRKNAQAAGVSAMASFEKADLFETDLSKASVITMFLLPSINIKLRPTILNLKPGTRIVSNTFNMEDWAPDRMETIDNCERWCTALLWYVPAKVEGAWRLGRDTMTITQQFQKFSGTVGGQPIIDGSLKGDEISFSVGTAKYTGRVTGSSMRGTYTQDGKTLQWTAAK